MKRQWPVSSLEENNLACFVECNLKDTPGKKLKSHLCALDTTASCRMYGWGQVKKKKAEKGVRGAGGQAHL